MGKYGRGIIDFPSSKFYDTQIKNGEKMQGWVFKMQNEGTLPGIRKSPFQLARAMNFVIQAIDIDEPRRADLYYALEVIQAKNGVRTDLKSNVIVDVKISALNINNGFTVHVDIKTSDQENDLLKFEAGIGGRPENIAFVKNLYRELLDDPTYDKVDTDITMTYTILGLAELVDGSHPNLESLFDRLDQRGDIFRFGPNKLRFHIVPDFAFSDSVGLVASQFTELPEEWDDFDRMRAASPHLDAIERLYHSNSESVHLFFDNHDRFMKIFRFGYRRYQKEVQKAASAVDEGDVRRTAENEAWRKQEAERKQQEAEDYASKSDEPSRKRQRTGEARLLASMLLHKHNGDVEAAAQMLEKIQF